MANIMVVAAAKGGQQQPLPLPDMLSPQQLRDWVIQRARPGGGGFGFLRTAQQWQQSQQETFSPQVLSELVSHRCVLGSVEAAALGASESAAAQVLVSASRYFFCDCTTLTPLAALVPVSLADPSEGPVDAQASTVLPCLAVPSGSLSGLHFPEFSTNLLSNAVQQDAWVDTFIPGGQRVAICKCSWTGRHLATFTCQVAASSRVSASGQLAASCSCQVLSHQTLLWHHCLGHPSLPRLHSMHSLLLVSGLPRSLPSLPRSPTPPCLPCIEGRQRAAPHSSEFPPTTAPPQTLHMDVWGPAPVGGTDQERYFLLVVDDYTRYTAVFPLECKADVSGVLIPWISATHRQLRERFRRDLPVQRLHSDKGGEFSSSLLEAFCRDKGIRQTFTLPASPQQNGVAERRIGLIMELNLWPRVSEPETSPTLRWTGKVGDALVFRVWGVLSLVRDAKVSKLSSRTLRCVFLGFPIDAPPWQLHHPRELRVFSSHDVTFDEFVCFYRLHLHASHPVPLAPLFLVPIPSRVDPLPPQGPAPSGVSQVDPPPLVEPLEISSDSSGPAEGGDPAADDTAATRRSPRLETPPGFPPRRPSPPPQPAAVDSGAETAGIEPGGAATGGAGSGGAATGGVASGGADSGGAASPSGGGAVGSPRGGGYGPAGTGAASPRGTAGAGGAGGTAGAAAGAGGTRGAAGARGTRAASLGSAGGAARAGGAGATSPEGATGAGAAGAGGAGGATGGTGGAGGAGAAGPGGARTRGAGAARAGGAAGAGGATGVPGAGGAGAGGARVARTAQRRPFFYPLPHSCLPPPDSSQPQLLPGSLLPAPVPHTEVTESLTERREPETRASTPVRARRVARPRPPIVPGTNSMALRPSSVPQRVVLPEPPASSLPHVPDHESNLARAASPTVTRLLASVVTDHDFQFTAAFGLVTELVDFAARSRLDYVASLVTESESVYPSSVGGEPALSSHVLEDRQFELECLAVALPRFASMLLCPEGDPDALDIPTPRSYAEAIAGEYSSQWQTAMDAEMASWKSIGTYVDEVPPPGANIVDGMWIFIVKWPPGSPPAFKARYVARGFSHRQGVDFFHTFSPSPKMTTLRVLLHVAAQRDYELQSLDFSIAFLQGSLYKEIWLRCPPGFTGSFPAGTQWSLRRPVYGLRQVPREWHDTLRTTLTALGFAPSSADLSLFLRTNTTLPPFYVLVYVDDLVFATADMEALALEQRWLTYLITDLGERPRSPPVMYVVNKAMLALCHEERLEHRMKHIALRYFLARELQQRRQLFLSYVASRANTADVFTKALRSVSAGHSVCSGGDLCPLDKLLRLLLQGLTGGAEPGGAETWGAEPGGAATGGAEPGGAEPGGTEPGGAEPGGTEPGGTEPGGAGSARVASRGASSRREVLSAQELREWFARRWGRAAGAGGTTAAAGSGGTCPGGAGAAGPGGTAETAGVGPTGGSAGASGGTGAAGSAGTGVAGATGVGAAGGVGAGGSADAGTSEGTGDGAAGAGGATGAGAPAGSPGAVPAGSGGATRPRPYFVPLLEQVLRLPPSPSPDPPLECPQPVQSQSLLRPVSPLPAPSPYTGPTGGLAERRAPASRPACTSRRTSRPRPPAVPGTHQIALRPSSSCPSDSLRAASPTIVRFLATVVTDPSLASTAASALVAELVNFAARCCLDYAASLVAESASVCPPSVGGECALSTDVLKDRQEEFQCFAAALPHLVSTLLAPEGDPDAPDIPTPRSYAEAIEGPYSSQWQAAMDVEMASWKSTGTYVDDVPPPGANIVSGMWIFRVKRPPGSPPVFKARYVARGFSQRQGIDYFQTFSPTPKMTTLRVLLHLAAQRDYELHSLDFSTAFLQGSLHEEIWLRRPPGFTGSFPPGTQCVCSFYC
ncbi:unnamed protein product [Closterium sp. NIES-54]